MNSARVSPGSIPVRLPTVVEQPAPAAAPLETSQTAPASAPEAPGRGQAAVFETAARPSTAERSGRSALPGPSADVPLGGKSVLQTRLTKNDILQRIVSPPAFSPERAAEIGAAFEKANLAGSLEWKPGVPRALDGIYFAAVNLPSAPSDGYTFKAYAFVGRENSDPNNATEVYVTRVGDKRGYARISLASNDASDAQALPRRSPAEELWKAVHGHYPDKNTTIMQKMNWEDYKIDFPE